MGKTEVLAFLNIVNLAVTPDKLSPIACQLVIVYKVVVGAVGRIHLDIHNSLFIFNLLFWMMFNRPL